MSRPPAGRGSGPLLARLVLTTLLPADRRDDLIGDLGELYAARRRSGRLAARLWYWRQVGDLLGRFSWERRRRVGPRTSSGGNFLVASDLKLALRMMVKSPGVTLAAVAAMAVGFALVVTAFTVVQQAFFGALPFEGGDRIVRIEDTYRAGGYAVRTSPEEFWRRSQAFESFEHVVGYETRRVGVQVGQGPISVVRSATVTANFFDMLAVEPLLGRAFRPDDVAADAPPVVVIGHALWRAAMAEDPGVIGRDVRLDGARHTIVGVMPEGFRFPNEEQAWVPIQANPAAANAVDFRLWTHAKLAEGVGIEQAEAELRTVASRVPPQPRYEVEEIAQHVRPFTAARPMEAMIAASGLAFVTLVLLVTAANVANLLLARTSVRMNEMAVRVALGASRARIVGQLFLEAWVLGGVAALIGLAASRPALRWVARNGDLPWWMDLRLEPPVIGFAFALTLLASAVAGLPPALKATRAALQDTLRDEGPGASGMRFGRLSLVLLVAQVTISVGFLSAAAIVGLALFEQGMRDYGVPEAEVLVAQVYWGQPEERDRGADDGETWDNFTARVEQSRRRLEQRLLRDPTVRYAVAATGTPGQPWIGWTDRRPFRTDDSDSVTTTNVVEVDAGYFDAYDVDFVAGRDFSAAERDAGGFAVIVNEPFVRKHLGGGNPLGRRLRWGSDGGDGGEIDVRPWLEIVGVVPDIGVDPIDPARADAIYLPMSPSNIVLLTLRTSGDVGALRPLLYAAAAADEMTTTVQGLYPLDDIVNGPRAQLRAAAGAALFIGAVALLLSACGLYAIMSFSVTRRTREIGIRRALGARTARLVSAILGRALVPLFIGSVLGAGVGSASAVGLTFLLPLDPWRAGVYLLVVAAALMIVVGAIACLVPARRVLGVLPMEALRRS